MRILLALLISQFANAECELLFSSPSILIQHFEAKEYVDRVLFLFDRKQLTANELNRLIESPYVTNPLFHRTETNIFGHKEGIEQLLLENRTQIQSDWKGIKEILRESLDANGKEQNRRAENQKTVEKVFQPSVAFRYSFFGDPEFSQVFAQKKDGTLVQVLVEARYPNSYIYFLNAHTGALVHQRIEIDYRQIEHKAFMLSSVWALPQSDGSSMIAIRFESHTWKFVDLESGKLVFEKKFSKQSNFNGVSIPVHQIGNKLIWSDQDQDLNWFEISENSVQFHTRQTPRQNNSLNSIVGRDEIISRTSDRSTLFILDGKTFDPIGNEIKSKGYLPGIAIPMNSMPENRLRLSFSSQTSQGLELCFYDFSKHQPKVIFPSIKKQDFIEPKQLKNGKWVWVIGSSESDIRVIDPETGTDIRAEVAEHSEYLMINNSGKIVAINPYHSDVMQLEFLKDEFIYSAIRFDSNNDHGVWIVTTKAGKIFFLDAQTGMERASPLQTGQIKGKPVFFQQGGEAYLGVIEKANSTFITFKLAFEKMIQE